MTLVERLILENQILNTDGLSQFQVYSGKDGTSYYLWGEHRTNSGAKYNIWAPIPYNYPCSRPCVYVYQPNPLWGFRNLTTINGYDISHRMHTLTNGPNGEVQICHWNSERWHSGITLNRVMLKIILWLEAYEQHLATGRDICDFVRTMSQN